MARPGHGRRSAAKLMPRSSSYSGVVGAGACAGVGASTVRRGRAAARPRWRARAGARGRPRPGRASARRLGRSPAASSRILPERDLELRQLPVDVVLGLTPHRRSVRLLGLGEDPRPPPPRRAGATASRIAIRRCSSRACSMRRSPSARAFASRSSRSRTIHRACLISSGSPSCISAIIWSTSSRLTSTEDDSGIDFASRTSSSSWASRLARSISRVPIRSTSALRTWSGTRPSTSPPEAGDLLHERGRQERPRRVRGHEQGLDPADPLCSSAPSGSRTRSRSPPEGPSRSRRRPLARAWSTSRPRNEPTRTSGQVADGLLQEGDALRPA